MFMSITHHTLSELAPTSLDAKKALYIKADISNSEETKAAIQEAVDVYSNMKGLIYCAAIVKIVCSLALLLLGYNFDQCPSVHGVLT